MKKTIAAGIGLLAATAVIAAKDPIIMTINGEDVPKSEFEYLYNKNSQQQINPQTIDEYVELFKLYKMKVAEAKAEGLDTLASFRKEMDQYRHSLAAPYMADSTFIYQLVDEAYDRSKREVEAKHIMLFKSRNPQQNPAIRMKMDSIRTLLLNGADFAQTARNNSQDRGSSGRGGRMGYIVPGAYPYDFEIAAYSTPEGQISEVVESPVGYHVLLGGKQRPARGRVKAGHILKLTRGMNPEQKAAVKATMDSIYAVVVANPDKFEALAKEKSEDPGSVRQGGMLPMFGAGEMVEQFDSVAFALPVGGISEPFETGYGYHIIRKYEAEPPMSKEEVYARQLRQLQNERDERHALIRKHNIERLAPRHKAQLNNKTIGMMKNYVNEHGIDSTFYVRWDKGADGKLPLMKIDGRNVQVEELIPSLRGVKENNPAIAGAILDDAINNLYGAKVIDAEENRLIETTPEYRYLLKEYNDGSLLYEVSVRNVWDKAAKDTEGMERYFQHHRTEYAWKEPHVKGYFVQTVNDSVGNEIKKRFATLHEGTNPVDTIRKEFKNQAVIEKVLIAKGGNPMIDHVVWGGPKVESSIAKYATYFMLDPRILNVPEEMEDVKGHVTSDYQNMFQERWEKELKAKYPVKVNEKVLKNVRPQAVTDKKKKH